MKRNQIFVVGDTRLQDKACEIRYSETLDCYELFADGAAVASCARVPPLSDFGFESGAKSIEHAYDLRRTAY